MTLVSLENNHFSEVAIEQFRQHHENIKILSGQDMKSLRGRWIRWRVVRESKFRLARLRSECVTEYLGVASQMQRQCWPTRVACTILAGLTYTLLVIVPAVLLGREGYFRFAIGLLFLGFLCGPIVGAFVVWATVRWVNRRDDPRSFKNPRDTP